MQPNRTFKAAWKPGTKKTTKDDLYCIKMRKRNEASTSTLFYVFVILKLFFLHDYYSYPIHTLFRIYQQQRLLAH